MAGALTASAMTLAPPDTALKIDATRMIITPHERLLRRINWQGFVKLAGRFDYCSPTLL